MKLVRFLGPQRLPEIESAGGGRESLDERTRFAARGSSRAPDPEALVPCAGIVIGEEIFDLRLAQPLNTPRLALLLAGTQRESALTTEMLCWDLADGLLQTLAAKLSLLKPGDFRTARHPLNSVLLLAPVVPGSFRDFYAFEQHVRNARKRRGLEMVPEWYHAPAFYFSNTASLVGPDAPIRRPPETEALDYELEIAIVIGKEGGDIPVAEADDYIAGFMILNDWSARDVQREEMKVGLGPAKGKDFATSIGPYLVTPDELEAHVLPDRSRGKQYDLTMTATVNGQEISRGNAKEMHWTFAELIAHAARNTVLKPGDLLGSGTVGTGCITEFPTGTYPWLQPGDRVTLEIERLGALTNFITA